MTIKRASQKLLRIVDRFYTTEYIEYFSEIIRRRTILFHCYRDAKLIAAEQMRLTSESVHEKYVREAELNFIKLRYVLWDDDVEESGQA